MDQLDRIAQADDLTPEEQAKALWQFMNDRVREELGTERPPPAGDDLAAHLKLFQANPDDDYRQAVADTHERTLGLVERLKEATRGLSVRSGSLASDLWNTVLTLTQNAPKVDNNERTLAMAEIIRMDVVTIAAGLRPWVPVLKPLLVHWYRHGATLTPANTHPWPLLPHAVTVSHLPELVSVGLALPTGSQQTMLPGFEGNDSPIRQALPWDLLDAAGGLHEGRSGAAIIKAWTELLLWGSQNYWEYPSRPRVTVRMLFQTLRKTVPSAPRCLEQLRRIQDAIYSIALQYRRPDGRLREIRPVAILDVPADRDYRALDEIIEYKITLPPGAQTSGVLIDRAGLRRIGAVSMAGYRALMNLAYSWHEHNRTLKRSGNKKKVVWLQSQEPEDYRPFSNMQQIALCFPRQVITGRTEHYHLSRAQIAFDAMERLQIIRRQQPKSGTGLILMPPDHFWGRPFSDG